MECRDAINNIPKPDFGALPQSVRTYFVGRVFGVLDCILQDEVMREEGDPHLETSGLERLFRTHFEALHRMAEGVPAGLLFQCLAWSYVNWFPEFSGVVGRVGMKLELLGHEI